MFGDSSEIIGFAFLLIDIFMYRSILFVSGDSSNHLSYQNFYAISFPNIHTRHFLSRSFGSRMVFQALDAEVIY